MTRRSMLGCLAATAIGSLAGLFFRRERQAPPLVVGVDPSMPGADYTAAVATFPYGGERFTRYELMVVSYMPGPASPSHGVFPKAG